MEDVTVSATYCDDIRNEVGGKISYMGVYNSDLLLSEFPAQLAKLCIQVLIQFPIETTASNITVKVTKNGESLAEIPLPEGQLQAMRQVVLAADVDSDLENRKLGCQLSLQFPSLPLAEPGAIRLLALVDGVEFKGNALRIRLPTAAEKNL